MGGQYEVKDGSTKKYYSIAGMMVAVNDGTGLQYLLTDHLGSTVAVTNSSGTLTSQQRYLPFGAPRTIPNSPILGTDFTYTGQRKLDNGMGGVMDYKARFYSPYLNHFLQPDTIIPDQFNPQAFNRYAYVLGNPLRYTDPSGHTTCDADGYCGYKPSADSVAASFGIRFENGSESWTVAQKLNALRAIVDVARNLGARAQDTAINTFRSVFNTAAVPLVFLRGNKGSQFVNDGSGFDENGDENYCQIESGGCTVGYTSYKSTGQLANVIKFESFSSHATYNVVHELGHAFYNELGRPALSSLAGSLSRDALIRNKTYPGGEELVWEQHPISMNQGGGDPPSELFADTFLAWTYNAWNPLTANEDAVITAQNAMNGIPLP